MVDAFDGQIEYSSGWSSAGEIAMETSVLGSYLHLDHSVHQKRKGRPEAAHTVHDLHTETSRNWGKQRRSIRLP